MIYNCPNCGAPITGRQCEYCGTIVREDPIYHTLIVERPNARLLCAEIAIAKELALHDEEAAAKYAKAKIARSMAESLQDSIRIIVREDPFHAAVIVKGEIRVLDPSFEF